MICNSREHYPCHLATGMGTEAVTVGADGMAHGTGGAEDSVICLFSPDRFARFTLSTFYPCILLFER